MPRHLAALAILLLPAAGLLAQSKDLEARVPAYQNPDCPVMAKKASSSLFVDVKGGRIYICCAPCIKKIRRDEKAAMAAAYPTVTKVGNTHCPVSGKPLPEQASTVVIQGKEIGLCCEACKDKALAEHQVTLVRAHEKDLRVLGNAKCPIDGKAVDPNAIIIIGKEIVHLSSLKNAEAVQKDPKAALAAAKKSVPEKDKSSD